MTVSSDQLGAWYEEAASAQKSMRYEEALEIAERILVHAPGVPQVHARKAEILWSLGKFEDALQSFEKLISLTPGDAEAHFGRGTTLQSLRRYQDAVQAYDRVLMLNSGHARAVSNKGVALGELGQIEQALKTYDRALALHPADVELHLSRAMALLLLGRWDEGWPEWEWRVRKIGPTGPVPRDVALWRGEALTGKTLFLQAEQGLGDTIQFCRYALVAQRMGAKVILQAQDRLVRLLQSLEGVTVIPSSAPLPASDYRLMLLSMPGRLRTTLADMPIFPAYLAPEQNLVQTWCRRLQGAGFRVGISWQGGTLWGQEEVTDTARSVPLLFFAGIAAIPGVRVISLQKNQGIEQLAALPEGMAVETLGEGFDAGPDAFCDCAAVMKNLDLVITTDTSVAHLAGALGVPVWLAVKQVPDWRWLLNRTDSVWYPSMRIFRQQTGGDWGPLFLEMERELRAVLKDRKTPLGIEQEI